MERRGFLGSLAAMLTALALPAPDIERVLDMPVAGFMDPTPYHPLNEINDEGIVPTSIHKIAQTRPICMWLDGREVGYIRDIQVSMTADVEDVSRFGDFKDAPTRILRRKQAEITVVTIWDRDDDVRGMIHANGPIDLRLELPSGDLRGPVYMRSYQRTAERAALTKLEFTLVSAGELVLHPIST